MRELILGAVQGLTEFVPVSSSAHLVLVPYVLGWPIPSLAFDVAVHLGTGVAVIVYFWRELTGIVIGTFRTIVGSRRPLDVAHARLAGLLVIASIPAGVFGIWARDFFEDLFGEPVTVAILLLGTAALLVIGEVAVRRRGDDLRRDLGSIGLVDAIWMGLLQAVSIAPGISRSGATMAGGLLRGLSRSTSARFAFLMSLPAILGAGLIQIPDLPSGTDVPLVLGAGAVAGVVGLLSIRYLLQFLKEKTLAPFAVYCVIASAIALGLYSQIR